jgi:lipopolysaccharide export system permease protein
MSTLDRYLLRQWTRVFLVVMLGFPILVIVIDLTDKLGQYLGKGLSRGTLALAYIYGMPETMFFVLPAAVLFATTFTVGPMSRYSEVTAAKAGGVSFYRLIRPLLAVSAAMFAFGLVLGEAAPGGSSKKAELLGEKQIRSRDARPNFVYRADAGWVYVVGYLELGPRAMHDVVLEREGSGADYPTILIAAEQARYKDSTKRWTLSRGQLRYFLGAGREFAFAFDSLRPRQLTETPTDLLAEPKAPDEMRFAELGRYIDALSRSGSDTKKLVVERALKIAIPFTCIVIALFGAPLAMTNPRSGAAWGLGVSLVTTFVFLLLVQLSKAIGAGGVLPPTFAAWCPNLVFGGLAVWLLRKTPT